jgi:hypothetical protein
MADYDRDGFLDLYLCVYSYFSRRGEDKAGNYAARYYDAAQRTAGILLRNDGHGHFVDAPRKAGLDSGNDRYHFAAAWGGLRWRRLAGSPGRERFRDQEPRITTSGAATARRDSRTWRPPARAWLDSAPE